jgi:hypothetical protein
MVHVGLLARANASVQLVDQASLDHFEHDHSSARVHHLLHGRSIRLVSTSYFTFKKKFIQIFRTPFKTEVSQTEDYKIFDYKTNSEISKSLFSLVVIGSYLSFILYFILNYWIFWQ